MRDQATSWQSVTVHTHASASRRFYRCLNNGLAIANLFCRFLLYAAETNNAFCVYELPFATSSRYCSRASGLWRTNSVLPLPARGRCDECDPQLTLRISRASSALGTLCFEVAIMSQPGQSAEPTTPAADGEIKEYKIHVRLGKAQLGCLDMGEGCY